MPESILCSGGINQKLQAHVTDGPAGLWSQGRFCMLSQFGPRGVGCASSGEPGRWGVQRECRGQGVYHRN